jgi:hypothetical protein
MRSAWSRHQGAGQHCRCGLRGNNRPALRRVAIRESRFTRRERLGQPQAEFCLRLNDRSKQSLPVVRLASAEGRNWAGPGFRRRVGTPPLRRRAAVPPRVAFRPFETIAIRSVTDCRRPQAEVPGANFRSDPALASDRDSSGQAGIAACRPKTSAYWPNASSPPTLARRSFVPAVERQRSADTRTDSSRGNQSPQRQADHRATDLRLHDRDSPAAFLAD